MNDATPKRRNFFNSLYSNALTAPRTDLPTICAYWKDVLGADWVWFWLFNDLRNQWQLLASAPWNEPAIGPRTLSIKGSNAVNDFVNIAEKPIWIDDMTTWNETHNGIVYKVACSELHEMGCLAFQTIPLLPPEFKVGLAASSQTPKLRMSICAHYRDPSKRVHHDDESLLMMGRAAAQAIMNSYLMEQRGILHSLNSQAAAYLTKRIDRPLLQRQKYIKEVIQLVKQELAVERASIFYRTPGGHTLECLGTTGLYVGAERMPVAVEKLAGAVYRPGEGVTWKVFDSGQPHLALIGSPADQNIPHKYTELPPGADESTTSWIVYPISEPIMEASGRSNRLGVIRAVGTTAHLSASPQRDFDQMQILLLDVIARQIGFVVETLTASASRERQIGTVRHDLLAPMQMIRDTVEGMLPEPMPFQEEIPTHLKDLLFSAVTGSHLIPLLDPNPTEISECQNSRILLAGDIVARLKAMLTVFARRQADMKISFGDFGKIPAIKGDRVLIERVLYNLIINAIKYGARGTEIKVIPTLTKDGVVIGIMNEGTGVLDDEKDQLFEADYRSPRFQKKLGLGFGLKIARAAMRKQGGDVVLSQQSNPTIFSVVIPRKLIVD